MSKLLELEDVTAPVCCAPLGGPLLSEDEEAELATVFKAIADPVRLRLLNLIASRKDGEACVCDLTGPFDLTAPTISHHLKVLRQALERRPRRRNGVDALAQTSGRQRSPLLHIVV